MVWPFTLIRRFLDRRRLWLTREEPEGTKPMHERESELRFQQRIAHIHQERLNYLEEKYRLRTSHRRVH